MTPPLPRKRTRPEADPPRSRTQTFLIVGAVTAGSLGLLFLVALGQGLFDARKPPPAAPTPAAPGSPDWPKVGDKASVGDLAVTLMAAARAFTLQGTYEGRISNPTCLVVQLKLTNDSKTRVAEFQGWAWSATASDEHGNEYKRRLFGPGYSFDGVPVLVPDPATGDFSTIIHGRTPIHPGKSIVTYLFFDPAADAAREVRLTLPAEKAGGTGDVYLRAAFPAKK